MYTLTQEDLDSNPLLVDLGYSAGDEIEDKSEQAKDSGPVTPPPPPPFPPKP